MMSNDATMRASDLIAVTLLEVGGCRGGDVPAGFSLEVRRAQRATVPRTGSL
jgi:hypothetical protein